MQRNGSTNELSWPTRPTRLYRLQSTTNLITGTWTNVSPEWLHSAAGNIQEAHTPANGENKRYYRVQVTRPLSQ
jgi:hypothetical protein